MNRFAYGIDSLTNALEIYMNAPCASTKNQLINRIRVLKTYYEMEQQEIEDRMVKKILSELAVSADVTKAVSEIDKLNDAINRLGGK